MLQEYYFFLREDYQKSNSTEYPICLRFYQKGKRYLFSLGISADSKYWDKKKNRVKHGDKRHIFKNRIIESFDLRAQRILADSIINRTQLTAPKFIEILKNNFDGDSFFEFTERIIKEKESIVGRATHKNYSYQVNKLKDFRKEFTLSDVDLSFIRNYDIFLKNELKNQESTRSKSIKFLRMIINEAIKYELLSKNPFNNFKIKEIKGKDDYLSFNELETLENLYKKRSLTANRQNVLRYFLFACYTGIAHGDLSKLKFSDLKKVKVDEKEYFIIDNERIKTGTKYRVPLIPKAVDLLGKKFQPYQKLFNVYANQPTNRLLKDIAKDCKIDRNISFHISRHTFGTHGTTFGIPEKLLMEMMGHKDLKVSRMYSKIQDETLINIMRKLESPKL